MVMTNFRSYVLGQGALDYTLDGHPVARVGLAPGLERLSLGVADIFVVQTRQPIRRLLNDLFGTHDSGSAACRLW